MEGEDIDPTMGSAVDDLDFACRRPPEAPQTSINVRRASGVNCIVGKSSRREDRRVERKLEIEAECFADPIDHVERRVSLTQFDLCDVGPRHSDPLRNLLLRQV